jgi:hypothetical protein
VTLNRNRSLTNSRNGLLDSAARNGVQHGVYGWAFGITFVVWPTALALVEFHLHRVIRIVRRCDVKAFRWQIEISVSR